MWYFKPHLKSHFIRANWVSLLVQHRLNFECCTDNCKLTPVSTKDSWWCGIISGFKDTSYLGQSGVLSHQSSVTLDEIFLSSMYVWSACGGHWAWYHSVEQSNSIAVIPVYLSPSSQWWAGSSLAKKGGHKNISESPVTLVILGSYL